MKLIASFVVLFGILCLTVSATVNGPIVQTQLGSIRGSYFTTNQGVPFYGFRGIRYATPPVGDLRFRNPVPVKKWNGIFDATEDGPICPQPKFNNLSISEDCLRLNVYTKDFRGKKPVIFFIHPGAFYGFDGTTQTIAGPEFLMNKDVVLVSINYRLGALGFMSTGTSDCPGNAGYKDQVLALKWVRDNISKFGGDPKSVTILGYSAGGYSATLHMVSPMSKGLFHRVIAMSGSAIAHWEIPKHQLDLAQRQARLVNCSDATPKAIINCLRKVKAEDIGNTLPYMYNEPQTTGGLLKPVIEKNFGQERFLVEDPIRMYQLGRFERVPVIAGVTEDEFLYFAANLFNDNALLGEFDRDFNKVAPIHFLFESNPNRTNIAKELRRTILGNEPLNVNRSLTDVGDMFSDSLIAFGVNRFVRLASKYTTVYYYKQAFHGRDSFFKIDNKPIGIMHHDDLVYLFNVRLYGRMYKPWDPEFLNVQRMTGMWTNFARTGNPNGNLGTFYWTPYKDNTKRYLDIGKSLAMKQNLFGDRYAVWDRLFPLSRL